MVDVRRRPLLPMAAHVRGKRSAVTCQLKCANACLGDVCNTSRNAYLRDIVDAELSRRALLGAGVAGTVALLTTQAIGAAAPAQAAAPVPGAAFGFTPIAPVAATVDELTVPEGFTYQPILRWGDPLFLDSPAFDAFDQTEAKQRLQFGYNCDYTDILRIDATTALLFVNHEYTNETIMFPAAQIAEDPARVRAVARAAHGLSVVELTRANDAEAWEPVVGGRRNRRFLDDTPYAITGPAAGSPLLRTVADPTGTVALGTLGNCAGGTTPWGTILSGEENFNGYFAAAGATAADRRYGLTAPATARGWELDDPRFDTRNPGYENEANRFGWIVEIDPFDPTSTPRKHTAMGRMKHEGANVHVGTNGRVAAYMGDDERFDYLYKFVSAGTYVEGDRAANMTLLETGDLYVAQLEGNSTVEIDGSGTVPSDGAFDGVGRWLPLVVGGASQVAGWAVDEVLVNTRGAADLVGATKMDRCEDVEPNPRTGLVYVACTNNSNRGTGTNAPADEANPRTQNRDGHVIEIAEDGGDHSGTTFRWSILMLCGDPAQGDQTYFAGFPVDQVSPISCPDNLAFDSEGNLWVSTDGAPDGIGYNDGLFRVRLEGAQRGLVEQFLSVPVESETCGPVIHDDEWHVFVAVQHPGEDGLFETPSSLWPDYAPAGASGVEGVFHGARPSVVQVLPVPVAPSPGPSEPTPSQPGPSAPPSGSPSAPPVVPSPSDGASPSGSAVPAPTGGTGGSGGSLPQTGAGLVAPLVAGASAALAVGAGLVARMRGTGSDADAGSGEA
ncbi:MULTISPECIES: PhoX family protein [unclassified Agrococcus]|uniref:PhoX family protein n=1 Tax=unclassified Agrococcus TaxID=2615065 RepID=UPI0036132387